MVMNDTLAEGIKKKKKIEKTSYIYYYLHRSHNNHQKITFFLFPVTKYLLNDYVQ